MDIQAAKIELAKLILNIENPSLLHRLKEMVIVEQQGSLASLTQQEKTEIELGLSQLDAGKRTSWEDFMQQVS